jgi:hypothetical protein
MIKRKTLKRTCALFVSSAVVCGFFYACGFDFNKRGEVAAVIYIVLIFFGSLVAIYPFDES